MASVKPPTPAELAAVGKQLGMNLSDEDVTFFVETMTGSVGAYALLESMPDHLPPVKYPRTRGYRPEGAENPYNAWYYKSEVKGAPSGKLAGHERRAPGRPDADRQGLRRVHHLSRGARLRAIPRLDEGHRVAPESEVRP